jgi:plastocyanin
MIRKLAAATTLVAAIAVVPAHAAASKTVAVKNNAFAPSTVKVHKGDKVVFKWTQGGVAHNVTPTSGAAGSATSSKKGFTFAKTFAKAGTFKYICTIHPSQMKVTVKVS